MGGYKKKGKGRGNGGGSSSSSSSSSSSDSSVEAPLDDAACRAMGFDSYDPATGQCVNAAAC